MQNKTMPWSNMLAYAVYNTGIRPVDFWNLTMLEFLDLKKHSASQDASISREELNTLVEKLK